MKTGCTTRPFAECDRDELLGVVSQLAGELQETREALASIVAQRPDKEVCYEIALRAVLRQEAAE